MTPSQAKAVEFVREQVLINDSHHQDGSEYKRFEVTKLDWGSIQVITEVGLIGDEGTMAQVFARTRRHIFIGRRGGLTLCNPARFVEKDGAVRRIAKKGWIKGKDAARHPTI